MSRTLLYYPTFQIPSRQWLIDSVLYWDNIGSIVPERLMRMVETTDLRYLADEDIYRAFDPESALRKHYLIHEFEQDFVRRLDSPQFGEEQNRPGADQTWPVAFEKMTHNCLDALKKRQLATDKDCPGGWIRVQKTAAIIYMGLLADYLATNSSGLVLASTDNAEYEDIVYRSRKDTASIRGLALLLKDALPSVAPETELREVVEFRRQRRDELLRLRSLVDEAQLKLSKCEDTKDAKYLVEQFRDQLEIGLNDISRTIKENGLQMVVGSLRAIFALKSPAWLMGVAFGFRESKLGGLPVAMISSACGFAAGATIELAQYGIEMREKKREIQEHPLSYLYSAKKSGII
ncbi:MAG: DUF6236 family protein [Armatimonadota bacterium]|nr:DUF6236 family protein [bacterium]